MSGRNFLSPEELRLLKGMTSLTEAQIVGLHKAFVMLNPNITKSITKETFRSIPSLASNPLLGRVLTVLNMDSDDRIDFRKFVKAFAIFSPQADEQEKLLFTYKIYDMDGDGKISNKDLFETLKIMVGTNLNETQLQQIVDKTFIEVDSNRDGYVTFDEFEKLSLLANFGDKLNLPI